MSGKQLLEKYGRSKVNWVIAFSWAEQFREFTQCEMAEFLLDSQGPNIKELSDDEIIEELECDGETSVLEYEASITQLFK